jgi:hypothetical protein
MYNNNSNYNSIQFFILVCCINSRIINFNKIENGYSLEYTKIPKSCLRHVTGGDVRRATMVCKVSVESVIRHHCCKNMSQGHCYNNVVQGHFNNVMKDATDRQTDMNGPIRCSLLTLKREEHIITIITTVVWNEIKRHCVQYFILY